MLHRARLILTVLLFAALTAAPAKTRELIDYGELIRPKDAEAIARIPKKILNDDELRKHLQQVSLKVEETLSPSSREYAGQIMEGVRRTYPTAAAQAAAANGCAVAGHLEEALLIMGKVCREDASNPDNLNNYAAFLTMAGGGSAAIPILTKLNQQFPNNSTVLNNLGQAWFDLGDLEEAEKHLEAAIRIFSRHAQANYTKSIIEGSRGNKAGAIAALKKSLQSAFSEDRANQLEELGGSLDFDADWGFRLPKDALGLDNIVIPPYPKSVGAQEEASKQWETFREQCRQGAQKLEVKGQRLEKELADRNAALEKLTLAAMASRDPVAMAELARQQKQYFHLPFNRKAMAKLVRLEEDGESMVRKEILLGEKLYEVEAKTLSLRGNWQKEREVLEEMAMDVKKDLPFYDCEGKGRALQEAYLPQINGLWEEYNAAYVDFLRKSTNSQAYFGQYTTPGGDLAVEALLNKIKRDYLLKLAGLKVEFLVICVSSDSSQASGKKSGAAGPLQDFYDLNCDRKSEMGIRGVWSIKVACNKMAVEFKALPGLEAKWTENLDTNQLINGGVKIGVSKEIGSKELGPLTAEAEIGVGMFLEFDSNGITDGGPYGGIGGGADGVNAGLEARWGWTSGFKGSGGGVLDGLEF
jgi:Flp pilus assembly protein TadD